MSALPRPLLALGGVLVALLLLPLAALLLSASPAALAHPELAPALGLSLATSVVSLSVIVVLGTPLAWWLATSTSGWTRPAAVVVDLPIVVPPAVIGVGLLAAFGRQGIVGGPMGLSLAFTPAAVVLAQTVVAAPFYVTAATTAFRRVDVDLLVVARTLGATPWGAFRRVAVPIALPGLIAGASLAWARALGEFGATLLFAGNLPGSTRTLPLAIYTALEADHGLAVGLSLVLCAVGGVLLLGMRGVR